MEGSATKTAPGVQQYNVAFWTEIQLRKLNKELAIEDVRRTRRLATISQNYDLATFPLEIRAIIFGEW